MTTRPATDDLHRQRLLQASAGRALPAVAVLAVVLLLLLALVVVTWGALGLLRRAVSSALGREQDDGETGQVR